MALAYVTDDSSIFSVIASVAWLEEPSLRSLRYRERHGAGYKSGAGEVVLSRQVEINIENCPLDKTVVKSTPGLAFRTRICTLTL